MNLVCLILCVFLMMIFELFETVLTEDDKFLVLASDGVWEFLQNEEV